MGGVLVLALPTRTIFLVTTAPAAHWVTADCRF
jgi:hypothetical protein